MLFRSRGRATRAVVSTAVVAAVAAAGLAATPAQAGAPRALSATVDLASSGAATAAKPSVHVVTLLTGDRVVLRTDAAGRTTAALTPDSPHAGRPIEYVDAGSHTWVVPKLAPAVRAQFDPSVFDVRALTGRVPLTVTFADGTPARDLPGLDVRTSSARREPGGRTTATASYDAGRPLPARLRSALTGVASIAITGSATGSATGAAQPAGAYELHTLTINATDAQGLPLPWADVFVLNTDDGRLFGAFGTIVDGQWKVSVPDGNYAILGDDFRRLHLSSATVVGDTTTSFSMSESTLKPAMTLAGYKTLQPQIDLLVGDAAGHVTADLGVGGFLPRVNPVAGLASGTLHAELSNLWTVKSYRPYSYDGTTQTFHPMTQVAAVKKVLDGIPHRLTFDFRPRDFAHVDIKHYATGPKTNALDGWIGFTPLDRFGFTELFTTARPGVVHALFQGGQNLTWDSSSTVDETFRNFSEIDDLSSFRRGEHAVIPFFRGPVTPVADTGGALGTSVYCSLCVDNGVLHGFMSMLSSAGTQQRGFDDHGTWALFHGRDRLQRGRLAIRPSLDGVTPGERLTLTAATTPPDRKYLLSSHVQDRWTFTVGGDGVVPLLRADYVPPTDLSSHGPTGTVRFPITFSNLGPVESRVVSARVRFSVDGGRSWHSAGLKRKDKNTFAASYQQPRATAHHRFVSLRVDARDAQGRRVSESVLHAYLLPRAGSGAGATPASGTPSAHAFRPGTVCTTPSRTTYACHVRLDPRTRLAGRSSPDPQGWGAPAIRDAYDLPDTGAATTVAVVVAYDDPSAEADLNRYRRQFALPPCTSANGCFTKINQKGQTSDYPHADQGWGVETSLDLQMISTACPTCHLVLAEANQPSDRSLNRATRAAAAAGATVTNHSYSRMELTGDETADGAYSIPGVTAVAASGDAGYGPAQFPASSPHVIAVGGTTLARTIGGRGWTEKAWAWTGSGCSAYFAKPAWQTDPACHTRMATDVSAVARGLAIFDTSLPSRYRGWLEVDGTSASSPLIAGMVGSSGTVGLTPDVLYADSGLFNDVVSGRNGFCNDSYVCTAGPGYDGPTGLGTPEGLAGFQLP